MADTAWRFYVYRFDNDDGECIYIGKGTGRRLKAQNRRFGREGYIVKLFKSESAAFNYEARLIAKLKPSENKIAGGGGAITRTKTPRIGMSKEYREMRRIGTRAYVARALLRFDLRGFIPDAEIPCLRERMMQAANLELG
jgi:hypothetical protein